MKKEKAKQELIRPANESRKESEREHSFAAKAFWGNISEESTRILKINSPYSGLGVSLINFDLVFAFLFSIP